MTAALDTSFVVRYLMGVPAEAAHQASEVIDSAEELEISGIALAETALMDFRDFCNIKRSQRNQLWKQSVCSSGYWWNHLDSIY